MTTPRREAFSCFGFNYITFIEGRRSEKLKTLVQPSVRFPLWVAPLWRPPPSLYPIPFRHPHTQTHTHTHSPQHTRGLCCLSVVGWLRNLLTHTFSQGLSVRTPSMTGWSDMCTYVHKLCIHAMTQLNTTEVGLNIYLKMQSCIMDKSCECEIICAWDSQWEPPIFRWSFSRWSLQRLDVPASSTFLIQPTEKESLFPRLDSLLTDPVAHSQHFPTTGVPERSGSRQLLEGHNPEGLYGGGDWGEWCVSVFPFSNLSGLGLFFFGKLPTPHLKSNYNSRHGHLAFYAKMKPSAWLWFCGSFDFWR